MLDKYFHNIQKYLIWMFLLMKTMKNIPDDRYRMLIIGGSGSRKTNVLLNLIKEQDVMNLLTRFFYIPKT